VTPSTLSELWPEIDRVALCVHRPSGSDPEFRQLVQRLQIPAGSFVVAAARHTAAGRVTLEQLELLSRYESRSLVKLNAQRHVELGFFEQAGEGEFVPIEPFRHASRFVLDLQGRSAEHLWAQCGELAELAALAGAVVERAAVSSPVPTPAFDAERGDHDSTPSSPAGQLLAFVTELRYLRSDLHAHALGAVDLAGPTARAVHRLWKGHDLEDEDIERLTRKGLIEQRPGPVQLTDAARKARDVAEAETDRLSAAALAAVPDEDLATLQSGLTRLPGEDPRPPDTR
jgi:hypothetical protein